MNNVEVPEQAEEEESEYETEEEVSEYEEVSGDEEEGQVETHRHRSEENNDRSENRNIWMFPGQMMRSHLSSPTPVLSPTVVSSVRRRPDTQTEHRGQQSGLH